MLSDNPPKICIVGLGPAGVGAALTLSKLGRKIDLICIEAGNSPTERECNILSANPCDQENYCQVTCGFGGCAFVSGGKLSDFPAGKGLTAIFGSEERVKKTLDNALEVISRYLSVYRFNVNEIEIRHEMQFFSELGFEYRYYDAYLCKQHNVIEAFKKMYNELKSNGASLLMKTELLGVKRKGKGLDLIIRKRGKSENLYADFLILALGRSGRQALKSIGSMMGLEGQCNSIDVGVRLEFPTELHNNKVKIHNDLKLLFGNARTFCVCKDGEVVRYYNEGIQLTEGRCTNSQKTGNTNIGIIVRLPPSEKNEKFYQQIQQNLLRKNQGKIISQTLLEYVTDKKFLNTKKEKTNLADIFPEPIKTNIRDAVLFFAEKFFLKNEWRKIKVYAPEIDYGGMLFPLTNNFSVTRNMYIIGDCSGRFRGILQSFGSGIYCAKHIIGELNEGNQ